MTQFAFLLGRKHLLSIAELTQTVILDPLQIESIDNHSLIWNGELADPERTLDQLGGIKKIIQIYRELPAKPFQAANYIAELACEIFAESENKVKFAISVENIQHNPERVLKNALLETKKRLAAQNIRCRFINKDFQNPELASLKSEKIISKGAEIVLIENNGKYYLGTTSAFQDIDSYSIRDYERPERDPKIGMLPPKLAQIMLNLSGNFEKSQEAIIYDPFCGLGTILGEALLQDMKAVGSDLNYETLIRAKKNIQWLCEFFDKDKQFRFFHADCRKLTKQLLPEKVTGVVSETYLGPPIYDEPPREMMQQILEEVENLLIDSTRALAQLLSPETPLVLSVLTYRIKKDGQSKFHYLPTFLEKMADLGYETTNLIPAELAEKLKISNPQQLKSLIYERPDQVVCRSIYKFIRTPKPTAAKSAKKTLKPKKS